MKKVKDNTVPFNPNNPKHLKGFEQWVKKVRVDIPKNVPNGILMPRKLYKMALKIKKSILVD